MARQQTQFNPATKEFEAYLDFGGGHNSEVSNERLSDNEFPRMINVDNSGRGSAKTRSGRVEQSSPGQAATKKAQGIFNFYRADRADPDIIFATSGELWVWKRGGTAVNRLTIFDQESLNHNFLFQSTLSIEAAQYQNNLFIATGTKLVEVTVDDDFYTARTVMPYVPSAMEVIHIGTNALSSNPDSYIQDGIAQGSYIEAVGIKPQFRNGAVATDISMTAYINKPSGYVGVVEYKWEYKQSSETTWTVQHDFTPSLKANLMRFDGTTAYDIKVTVRKAGEGTELPDLKSYTLSSYVVKATMDPPAFPVSGIQRCRKIMLHWDRLLMCADDLNPYQMYISDLQAPRYFPTSNTITFDFGKQEPITAVVRFQDLLVVFTRTTIQTLVGKSTDTYARFMIHDGLGCIAGRTAAVVGNNIIFLSQDGVYALRPNPYRIETLNVQRIDQSIQHEIDTTQTDACAMSHDSQYWLCYPQSKKIYRYYYERKVWVLDESPKLNISQFLISANQVYNLTTDARMYRHDREVFTDAGVPYDMILESKFYDLSASFNNKKLKRLYILAKHYKTYDVDLSVTVKADSAIVLTPETMDIVEDTTNGWYWRTVISPNFEFPRGTAFGTWLMGETPFGDTELSVQQASVRGKCRRVKITIVSSSNTPCDLYGFALQFKLKKV